MRVGIINYRYPVFENGSQVQETVNSIAADPEVEQVVMMAACYPSKNFYCPSNVSVVWVPLVTVPVLGAFVYTISLIFRGLTSEFNNVDVINVFSARPVLAGKLLSFLLNKPIVCTIEIINPDQGHFADKIYNLYQRIAFGQKFDQVICWSRFYVDRYLSRWGVKQSLVSVIPCGIDVDLYAKPFQGQSIREKFPKDKVLIVFAKPMYEYNRKTAELLLEAASLLREEIPLHLLVGPGDQLDILKESVVRLKMEENVSYMPWVPFTEIPTYIEASDIIVLPFTYNPSTARSLFECLAMGKPVITTNMGEVSEILRDGEHALIVEPEKGEVAAAIVKLIRDRKLQDKLGKNAQKLMRTEYSVQKIARRTVQVYDHVLNGQQA